MSIIIKKSKNKNFFPQSKAITRLAMCLVVVFTLSSCLMKKTIPELDYMSFTLTQEGREISSSDPLGYGGTYRLTIKPEEGAALPTANYDITHQPKTALTISSQETNFIDFTVNNGTHQTVAITVTHKDDSFITQTLTLSLKDSGSVQKDIMSFIITRGGREISSSGPLGYGGTYRLTVKPEAGAALPTANYAITHQPATALTISSRETNFINFTVNNGTHQTVAITVTHKDDSSITQTLNLSLEDLGIFQEDIENATTVPDLTTVGKLVRDVLGPLGAASGATLEKRYVSESGGGTYDGSSWANAWAATNLRRGIELIRDATANKVYLIMIAGGVYKTDYSIIPNRSISFSMKDRVAIMGGFQVGGGWKRTGTTVLSGDIGGTGNSDNSYHVFFHNSLILNNSHLYGVVIAGGNADGYGGGMYNSGTSPVLTEVVFTNNTAREGGAMYNVSRSSPVLSNTVFVGNSSQEKGGGMYNSGASPFMVGVEFKGNRANTDGGGMFCYRSPSPVLIGAVFKDNSATALGGGVFSSKSCSPVFIGAVFRGNSANSGGGMMVDSDTNPGPLMVNSVFLNNSVNALGGGGRGPDIAMNFTGGSVENIRIAGSVLGLGLARATNAIALYNNGTSGDTINISHNNLTNATVNLGADATIGVLTYPTITAGSSAINLGLYVRRSGTTYYFSEDNNTWYDSFTTTGGWGNSVTPPASTEDLTATDITGKARTGRPDAGVYELP